MILKVYKKRTRWYFKYRDTEYCINDNIFLDSIEKLLNKKVLYFKLKFSLNSSVSSLFYYYWGACEFKGCSVLRLTSLLIKKQKPETIILPIPIARQLGRINYINIMDIR